MRYIEAEWLLNFVAEFPDHYTMTIGNFKAIVNDAPSIDIVRCKECKCWLNDHICTHWSGYYGTIETIADDFCSYGERKESE